MCAYKNLITALFCILLGANLQACAGYDPAPVVESISHAETWAGIESALAGEKGTFVLRSLSQCEKFIIGWYSEGGYKFVMVDAAKETWLDILSIKGQWVNGATMTKFLEWAQRQNDFRYVAASEPSLALSVAISQSISWLESLATMELLPVFTITGSMDLAGEFLPAAGEVR